MISKYRPGVFIVTYYLDKNNKPIYLLQKRKLHWKGWEFPKGGKNKFESNKKAVKREIKEETGLEIIKINKHKEKGKYKYPKRLDDRKKVIGQTYALYSAQIKKARVRLDKHEHSASDWLIFEKAIKKLTYSNQRKCLKVVHKFLTK